MNRYRNEFGNQRLGISSVRRLAGCKVALLLAMMFGVIVQSGNATLTVLGDSGYKTTGQVLATVSAPSSLHEMDHHSMYVWQLTGLPKTPLASVPDASWATLTFTGIYNWDTNPNRLYLWLFDKAKYSGTTLGTVATGVTSLGSGVTTFIDDPSQSVPDTLITDDFNISSDLGYNKLASKSSGIDLVPTGNNRTDGYGADGLWFAGPGHAVTYTYVFTPSQVTQLNAYLADGTIAFGLDSDCHYFDTNITFRMGTGTLSTVPEGSSLLPLLAIISGAGVVKLVARRRAEPAV